MKAIPQQAFTAEFKELAVRRVNEGQTIPAVGREFGISQQTVRNWVRAANLGKLMDLGSRVVTPADMELSRLRAEVARLQAENAHRKKAPAYFAKDVLLSNAMDSSPSGNR